MPLLQAGPLYPSVQPCLSLREVVGLGEARQQELLVRLAQLAHSLEGGEMVYQLAIEVGVFLAQHNRKGFGSMAEEMTARRLEEDERREEGLSQLEDSRRRDLVREVEERRREIEEEQARLRLEERTRTVSESEGGPVEGGGGRRRGRASVSEAAVEEEAVSLRLSLLGESLLVLRGRALGVNTLGQVWRGSFCLFTIAPSSGDLLRVQSVQGPVVRRAEVAPGRPGERQGDLQGEGAAGGRGQAAGGPGAGAGEPGQAGGSHWAGALPGAALGSGGGQDRGWFTAASFRTTGKKGWFWLAV